MSAANHTLRAQASAISIGDFGWSHPGHWERAASLAATRDEILAKRQRGEALVPTPARGAFQDE